MAEKHADTVGVPWLDRLGRVGQFAVFSLRSAGSLPANVLRPGAFCLELYYMLSGSLAVAAVAGAALGTVAWLQLHSILVQLGSGDLLPRALAVAVLWELGPITAGLIAAGRIGAGLGAEFGSMRLTEQLDAVAVMGVSAIRRLVAPRVLACMAVLPLLTILIDYIALGSGYVAELIGGNMTWTQYRAECLRYLHWADVIPATLKTVVFGFFIGVTGCFCGGEATGGTEGVGRAATRAVVGSTLLVLISDVLLVRLIQIGQGLANSGWDPTMR
jgi:phospholipid/cholesterol/gamma-HCH transport system permease protein